MKKSIVFVCIVLSLLGAYHIYTYYTAVPSNPGTIIVLNGASCSGKSSIQKAFQEISEKPFLKMGIDSLFVACIPEKYILGTVPHASTIMKSKISQDEHGPLFFLTVGKQGRKIITGMHNAIVDYARAGNNVIVDYIMYDKEWMKEFKAIVKDLPVYWVGVYSSLNELEKREKARSTSPEGHARTHYESVHDGCEYDLQINSTYKQPLEIAKTILDYTLANPKSC